MNYLEEIDKRFFDCLDKLHRLNKEDKIIEREYYKNMQSVIHDQIQELKKENNTLYKDRRKEYLKHQIKLCAIYINSVYKNDKELKSLYISDYLRKAMVNLSEVNQFEKLLKKYKMDLRFVENDHLFDKERFNQSMIAKAKEYPIDTLLEIDRSGFTQCLWHEDTKPSLFCKNNFAYCFVCAKTADSIEIAMKKYDIPFYKAVKKLC